MKVLVVGYGSMGRRRIRLFRQIDASARFVCVDSNSKRIEQIIADGHEAYSSLDGAIREGADLAFVCTSPLSHAEIVPALLRSGIDTFSELNLSSRNYDELTRLASGGNARLFLSSTMLYKPQVQKIKELVRQQALPVTYIYHIGQYLPDWHPWENYRDFFVGKKESNGCREIYAIQLPWIVDTFGDVSGLSSASHKTTNLDIDYDDSFITILEHGNGNKGVFVVDVASRIATTYLEVIGEGIHLTWDGSNGGLRIYNIAEKRTETFTAYENEVHDGNYASNIEENSYLEEVRDFISFIREGTEPRWSIEKDRAVLGLIDRIEGVR